MLSRRSPIYLSTTILKHTSQLAHFPAAKEGNPRGLSLQNEESDPELLRSLRLNFFVTLVAAPPHQVLRREKVTNCATGLGMPILILSAARLKAWKRNSEQSGRNPIHRTPKAGVVADGC